MSILLDALRKSEQQQKLGSVPDIHSVDPVVPSQRPRWLLAAGAVFGLLLLLLVAYFAWRLWGDFTAGRASSSQVATIAPERAETGTRSSATAPGAPASSPGPATAVPEGSANDPAAPVRQPRSPVETLSGDRPFRAAAQTPANAQAPSQQNSTGQPATENRATSGASAANQRVSRPSAQAAAQAAAAARTGARPVAESDLAPAPVPDQQPAQERPPAPAPQSAQETPEDGLISYWQLPSGTRENLPAFRINVLVYDADPDRRFILMDGKRYQIGDTPKKNLRLLNIERERVVWRYGIYRFYVNQRS